MKIFKNKLNKIVTLSILIPLVFYLIVNTIIHGFSNMAIYDTTADMFEIIVCFMILFYSQNYFVGKTRKYLKIGSIFFISSRFIELVLQELMIMEIYGFATLWLISLYLAYIGIFYLFFGYRRLILNGN